MLLTEFDIVYVTQKAIKGQAIADQLAESPADDYEPMNTAFPNEAVLFAIGENEGEDFEGWPMYFDGGSNSKGAGAGAVVISKDGMHFPACSKLNFDATNNVSEYEACILGLRLALDMDIRRLAVVIKQSTEEYTTRDTKLIPYRRCLVDLCQNFDYIEFNHIP